ncbi:MAG: hypothetical protein AAF197_07765, partial [Pseudomonadota bacterium]
ATREIGGNTGMLSFTAQGQLVIDPLWARFKDGEAVIKDKRGLDLVPLVNETTAESEESGVEAGLELDRF